MSNREFWESVSVIVRNGFDGDGMIKLEQYAEKFISKR